MRTLSATTLIPLLGLALSTPALGMISFSYVTPKQARDMGLKVEVRQTSPGRARVELSFDIEGKLKDYSPDRFSRVELHLMGERPGGKGKNDLIPVLTTGLKESRPKPNQVRVSFSGELDRMRDCEVWVIIGGGLFDGGAYVLKMEEFVDLEELAGESNRPEDRSPPAPKSGGAPPASAPRPGEND